MKDFVKKIVVSIVLSFLYDKVHCVILYYIVSPGLEHQSQVDSCLGAELGPTLNIVRTL